MHAGQLFSEHFLVDGIRTTDAYRRLAEDQAQASALLSRLREAFARFLVQGSPDEAQTEQDLIFRILEALGWNRDLWLVQPPAARTGRSDVPDMLLFPDLNAKANALAGDQEGQAIPLRRGDRREQALGPPARPRYQGHEEGRHRTGGPLQPGSPLPVARRDALRSSHPAGYPQ